MKKIAFIINPTTINHKRFKQSEVEAFFDSDQYSLSFFYTKYKGHATELAKEALVHQVDIVVAVGGDGTTHEIAQALTNTTTILGIFPTGYQSAYPSYLGLPTKSHKILEVLQQEKTTKIDTIIVEKSLSERIIGICYVGIGLTSNTVHSIGDKTKKTYFYY